MYKFHIKPSIDLNEEKLKKSLLNFKNTGKDFVIGTRNVIKLLEIDGQMFLVKSFKIPNSFNRIVYQYFRKSKAQRSFENAEILAQKGIRTPNAIAYLEKYDHFGLRESYYAYEYIEADFTFAHINQHAFFPDLENMLRQFTQFTYKLHENGIEFLDHSAGNTLIVNEGDGLYSFYLIDLNRMKFRSKMNFDARMKNSSRLTSHMDIVAVMSNEYAKLTGKNETIVFNALWKHTQAFQSYFQRKRRIKKGLKFLPAVLIVVIIILLSQS